MCAATKAEHSACVRCSMTEYMCVRISEAQSFFCTHLFALCPCTCMCRCLSMFLHSIRERDGRAVWLVCLDFAFIFLHTRTYREKEFQTHWTHGMNDIDSYGCGCCCCCASFSFFLAFRLASIYIHLYTFDVFLWQ